MHCQRVLKLLCDAIKIQKSLARLLHTGGRMNNIENKLHFQKQGGIFFENNSFVIGFSKEKTPYFPLYIKNPEYTTHESLSQFIIQLLNKKTYKLSSSIDDIIRDYFDGKTDIKTAFLSFENAVKKYCTVLSPYCPQWFVQEYYLEYEKRFKDEYADQHQFANAFIKDASEFLEKFQSEICYVPDYYSPEEAKDLEILEHVPILELEECISYTKRVLEYHTENRNKFSKLDALEKLTLYTTIKGNDNTVDLLENYLPNLLKVRTYYGIAKAIGASFSGTDDEDILKAVQKMKNTIPNNEFIAYFENIHQLFFIVIYLSLSENLYIKQCEHCGKYFVPKTKSSRYCSTIIEDDDDEEGRIKQKRPCNQIVASQKCEDNMSPSTSMYRKLERRINTQISRLPKTYTKQINEAKDKKMLFKNYWNHLKASDLSENEKIRKLNEKYDELFPKT